MSSGAKTIRQGAVAHLASELTGVTVYDYKVALTPKDSIPAVNVRTPKEDEYKFSDNFESRYNLFMEVDIVSAGVSDSTTASEHDDLINLVRSALYDYVNTTGNSTLFEFVIRGRETATEQAEKKYFATILKCEFEYVAENARAVSGDLLEIETIDINGITRQENLT